VTGKPRLFHLRSQTATPRFAQVDSQGKTTEPIQVKYRVIAGPENPPQISLSFKDADRIVSQIALTDLTSGVHEVEIPSGLSFSVPGRHIEARAIRPDGSKSAAVLVDMKPGPLAKAERDEQAAFVIRPSFASVSPSSVVAGSQQTQITINGTNLGAMKTLFVGDDTGTWKEIAVSSAQSATFTASLPAAIFATPGFLRLSPNKDEPEASLAFVVGLPATPPAGTLSSVSIGSADRTDIGPGGTITLTGQGFVDGMKALIGRGSAIELPTVVIDETTIEVDLPPDFIGRASDLYVAVASADLAQRTASLPIVSQRPEATRDPAALYAPGELVLTEASGNVAWGENAQKIEVEGLGLEPGTMFELTSGTLTQLVPATAGSPSQSGSPGVQGVAIAVPARSTPPSSLWFR